MSMAAPSINVKEGSSAARQSEAKKQELQENTWKEVAVGPWFVCV